MTRNQKKRYLCDVFRFFEEIKSINIMKKLILTLVAACALAFSANAQFFGSASLGFTLNSSSGNSASTLYLAPGFGYNFSPKSAAGLYFALDVAGNSTQWSFNPYYRYTFANVKNAHFFAEAIFKIGQAGKDITVWGIGARPGMSYSFTDRFDVVAHVGFIGINSIGGTTVFGLSILQNTDFGVQFKF